MATSTQDLLAAPGAAADPRTTRTQLLDAIQRQEHGRYPYLRPAEAEALADVLFRRFEITPMDLPASAPSAQELLDDDGHFLEERVVSDAEIRAVMAQNGWFQGRQNNVSDALLLGAGKLVHDAVVTRLRAMGRPVDTETVALRTALRVFQQWADEALMGMSCERREAFEEALRAVALTTGPAATPEGP